MNSKEILDELVKLYDSSTWEAIKAFNRAKDVEVLNSLGATDPFKDPTSIARAQGIRIGVYYLEQVVGLEAKRRQEIDNATAPPTSKDESPAQDDAFLQRLEGGVEGIVY